jgi:hypothetical protein
LIDHKAWPVGFILSPGDAKKIFDTWDYPWRDEDYTNHWQMFRKLAGMIVDPGQSSKIKYVIDKDKRVRPEMRKLTPRSFAGTENGPRVEAWRKSSLQAIMPELKEHMAHTYQIVVGTLAGAGGPGAAVLDAAGTVADTARGDVDLRTGVTAVGTAALFLHLHVKSNAIEPGARRAPLRYNLGAQDLDWRGTGRSLKEALDEAFRRTGSLREEFEVTRWGRDKYGKSFPAEWRHKSGAEVSIDWPHSANGPDAPHVGWQTSGKRSSGGAARGHIILDEVSYNR